MKPLLGRRPTRVHFARTDGWDLSGFDVGRGCEAYAGDAGQSKAESKDAKNDGARTIVQRDGACGEDHWSRG